MNEKTTEKMRGKTWFHPGPISIIKKLIFLYILFAFGMLALATGFLYWVLLVDLKRENNQFLVDKIHMLRHIASLYPDNGNELDEEVKLEGVTYQYTKYYVRILDEGHHIIVESPSMNDIVPSKLFPDPLKTTEVSGSSIKREFLGKSFLLISAWSDVGFSKKEKHLIQIAMDVTHENALIADYRLKIFIVLLLGIIISTVSGTAVARNGMRPLKKITQAAQRINISNLNERIGSSSWPKELVVLSNAFDEMLNRLEDSFTKLSQFSITLAHELRTPINNLMGEAQVALTNVRTVQEYQQILGSSLEEYSRLSVMIDSLLFIAQTEDNEIKLELSEIDTRKEIENILEFYDAVSMENGVKVFCEGKALLKADRILFRRIIGNLLSNAFQYTQSGGMVKICVKQMDNRSVNIVVEDSGIGIDSSHFLKIFSRFYRTDSARALYPKGMGLGLYISKSIMDLHGGTITIQSELAKGTKVSLKFPESV